VKDAALLLQVIAGADPHDATAAAEPVPAYGDALTGDIRGIRIGVARDVLGEGVDESVRAGFESAVAVLRERGAVTVDIALPHAEYGIPVYYLIATAEASSNLARYDGVRYGYRAGASDVRHTSERPLLQMYERTRDEGFGAEVKRRIMLGTYVLSHGYYDAYYLKAQQVRTLLRQDYDEAFRVADVIAMPTTPTPAFKLGEKTSDPLQMYLADIFTVSANLAGLPAISVPCGFSPERLPVGLQLTGRMFDETTLLRVADAYQHDTDHHRRSPLD
jgi:aspartyl-tRNA(Asn)/glutamyl-tRNA(Gln) amidotransferase subunit A